MRLHASLEHEDAALRRAATRAQCSVDILAPIHGHVQGHVVCRDGWAGARLLYELAREDARTPGARRLAVELRGADDDDAYAKKLQRFVQDNIEFRHEQGEIFQGLGYTLEHRYGDCDDHARVVAALAWAGGLPARMGFLHAGGDPSHVAALLGPYGEFSWAETTLAARYGEHPLAAAKRLRLLDAREDLSTKTVVMSDDGHLGALVPKEPPVHTADLPDEFFAGLKQIANELEFEPVFALDVMWAESGIKPDAKYRVPPNKATGLIGFVGLRELGAAPDNSLESHDDFARTSAVYQLQFARKFWSPMKGRVQSAANLYQYNFIPLSLERGTSDDVVVAASDGTGYRGQEAMFFRANKGLDVDGDGAITVGDLGAYLEKRKRMKNGDLFPRYAEAVQRIGGAAPATPAARGGIAGPGLGILAIGVGLAFAWWQS